MRDSRGSIISAFAVCTFIAGFASTHAQVQLPTAIPQTHFSSGQDIVPVYEGWVRNPDGTFAFVFGYFNRNWKEELAIPAGPDNKLEPGAPDRGQPTYFLPRRQAWMFRVQVPRDWGPQELVWTITAHGRTEKAYAQLSPDEEITERFIMTGGNLTLGEDDPNQPPSVSIVPLSSATLGSPVTLTALVADDGLPKPRAARPQRPDGVPQGQTNSVEVRSGLLVTWSEYRGPAKVIFGTDGPMAVTNGQAVTTARFSAPGTYVLEADATDGALQTSAQVSITVKADESRP
jgi:hypothetical protein